MKKVLPVFLFLFIIYLPGVFSQSVNDTVVYLITCGPGAEIYSIYGHSALRVVIHEKKSDIVHNWGVFDFDTPNFTWKFAKGKLDYMLADEPTQRFLQGYFLEKRFVCSQIVNLNPEETRQLIILINENLKPENIKYRYDFFYDDCSTRIRDLFEKSIGNKLLYPPAETESIPSFRDMIGKYQDPYPWLKFGVDLLIGAPGDKKAYFRDRMFLPIEMKDALSEAVIRREGKMVPLLKNPDVLLDFDAPVVKKNFITSPSAVFAAIMIVVMILSGTINKKRNIKILDISTFSIFTILAALIVFFIFFTDHDQTKWNLNIIWLNPLLFFCLIALIMDKPGTVLFKLVFYIAAIFLVIHFFLPQKFNVANIPLEVIILVRSSMRAEFKWNPLGVKSNN